MPIAGWPDHDRVGGTPFHLGDVYIWAEIHYLDSPTDYREHLPAQQWQKRQVSDGVVLLDDAAQLTWSMGAVIVSLVAFLCCLLGGLAVLIARWI